MRSILAVVVAATLLPLSACSSAPQPAVTITATVTAEPTPSPTPTPTFDVAAEGWSNAKAFTEQIVKNKYDKAAAFVSEGSAADRYLVHMIAINDASRAAGYGALLTASDIEFDEEAKSITQSASDADPVVWQTFTWDDLGKITGWATGDDDTPLADRLWTKPADASIDYAKVTLVSAYKNDAGLWVVLDVKAKKGAVEPDCSPLLDDTKDRQREATNCTAPDKINKGKAAYVAFLFEGATFGGKLRYEVQNASYDTIGTVKLKIK